jgi:hypothetical protein
MWVPEEVVAFVAGQPVVCAEVLRYGSPPFSRQ